MSIVFFIFLSFNIFSIETEKIRFFSSGNSYEVEAVKEEVIVKISEDRKYEVINKLKNLGYNEIRHLYKNFYLAKSKIGLSLNYQILSLSQNNITFYPNKIYRPLSIFFNDPDVSKQWYLKSINMFSASEFEEYKTTVTIAVIDTGVMYNHEDLRDVVFDTNTWTCFHWESGSRVDSCVSITHWHGTAVSGIISAMRNGVGISGISMAKIYSENVFYGSNPNNPTTSESTLIKSLSYISSTTLSFVNGKLIINMSLGSDDPYCSEPLQEIINELYNKNIIIIAAAGNSSLDYVGSPANCINVVSVSATDENDNLAYFSNYGSAMLRGLSAPGVDIYTTTTDNGYKSSSGTSFSAPIVAGVMALVWAKRPDLRNYEVIDIVRKTARDVGSDGPDKKFGWGIVDAYKAISFLEANLKAKGIEKEILIYPNPFYPKKHRYLKFHIKDTEIYLGDKLMIYDFAGNFVAYVRYEGKDGFIWDGKNQAGVDVDSGVYIVYYKNEKHNAKSKFLLVR